MLDQKYIILSACFGLCINTNDGYQGVDTPAKGLDIRNAYPGMNMEWYTIYSQLKRFMPEEFYQCGILIVKTAKQSRMCTDGVYCSKVETI